MSADLKPKAAIQNFTKVYLLKVYYKEASAYFLTLTLIKSFLADLVEDVVLLVPSTLAHMHDCH